MRGDRDLLNDIGAGLGVGCVRGIGESGGGSAQDGRDRIRELSIEVHATSPFFRISRIVEAIEGEDFALWFSQL
jgi:hypothetical protein